MLARMLEHGKLSDGRAGVMIVAPEGFGAGTATIDNTAAAFKEYLRSINYDLREILWGFPDGELKVFTEFKTLCDTVDIKLGLDNMYDFMDVYPGDL